MLKNYLKMNISKLIFSSKLSKKVSVKHVVNPKEDLQYISTGFEYT